MQKLQISIMGCGWLGLPLGSALVHRGYEVKGSTTREERCGLLYEEGILPFCLRADDRQLIGSDIKAFFQSPILILNIPPGRKRVDVAFYHPKQIEIIVEQALNSGVQHILFFSSTSVYENTNTWVSEADEPKPPTESGKALYIIEQYLQAQSKLSVTILRLGGLVGGDRKAGRFLAGKKGLSNGQAPVNLIHRNDVIAIASQIIEEKRWGQIYNCCADQHPTRANFYQTQALKQGFEPPEFLSNGPLQYKIVSNQKVKADLDYTFLYADPMNF